jgi:uncharacterized protein (TIGR03435 family)
LAALSVNQGKEEKRQMLRALLAARFKLVVHVEKREMPIFALVIAKGGTKLATTDVSGAGLTGGRGRISIEGAMTPSPSWRTSCRGASVALSSIRRDFRGDMD